MPGRCRHLRPGAAVPTALLFQRVFAGARRVERRNSLCSSAPQHMMHGTSSTDTQHTCGTDCTCLHTASAACCWRCPRARLSLAACSFPGPGCCSRVPCVLQRCWAPTRRCSRARNSQTWAACSHTPAAAPPAGARCARVCSGCRLCARQHANPECMPTNGAANNAPCNAPQGPECGAVRHGQRRPAAVCAHMPHAGAVQLVSHLQRSSGCVGRRCALSLAEHARCVCQGPANLHARSCCAFCWCSCTVCPLAPLPPMTASAWGCRTWRGWQHCSANA
jgi:hypothetical protein